MFCLPLDNITLMVARRRTMPADLFSCGKHTVLEHAAGPFTGLSSYSHG